MAYSVKITFDPRKVAAEAETPHAQVCATFEPTNGYIDTPDYQGTRYDSNVKGFGIIPPVPPYDSTYVPMSVPLAQFNLATQAQVLDEETGVRELTFEVEDYKEAFYYNQLGQDMADQGFTVEVSGLGPATSGSDSAGGDDGSGSDDGSGDDTDTDGD